MLFWNLFQDGLNIWAKLCIVAVGYALVYIELRMINFAYGEVITCGAYVAQLLVKRSLLPLPLAIVCAIGVTIILSLSIERLAYRRLYSRGRLYLLISSIGVSIILQNVYAVVFGSSNLMFPILSLPLWVAPVVSLGLIVSLFAVLRFSRFGKEVKGVADSQMLAEIVGVNARRTIQGVFVLSGVLACAAGLVEGIEHGVEPTMGFNLGLAAFIAAVIGGLRSIWGAIWGSFIFSMILSFSTPFFSLPRELLVYSLVILIVLARQRSAGNKFQLA